MKVGDRKRRAGGRGRGRGSRRETENATTGARAVDAKVTRECGCDDLGRRDAKHESRGVPRLSDGGR